MLEQYKSQMSEKKNMFMDLKLDELYDLIKVNSGYSVI